ncbi:MAG TPA: hypothetical protein VLV78_05575 [Thermoanaerobaculia bacterium]|nr:hypothetical protein [Thermoanaerobaculia bacterium]
MTTPNDDRRGAERISIPKPVPASLAGFEVRLLEISLIGCLIEHTDRVLPKARMTLRFKWRGGPVKIETTVIRSEMRSVGGKPAYVSGLEFCKSIDESPAVIREIVGWLVKTTAPAAPAAPAAAPQPEPAPPEAVQADDDEPEIVSAPYLQCTLDGGEWMRLYVSDPKQPPDGFTVLAPNDESEVDVLCRAYEKASAEKRSTMRASFETAIRRNQR